MQIFKNHLFRLLIIHLNYYCINLPYFIVVRFVIWILKSFLMRF